MLDFSTRPWKTHRVAALLMTAAFFVLLALRTDAQENVLQGGVTSNRDKWSQGAKAASDRYEALQHGYVKPGTPPMQIIMSGYVPPGMPLDQAAMLYRSVPHLPKMPERMTPEKISEMAREPVDPEEAILRAQGLSRNQIESANQKMFEGYMRESFGPVYIPPMHRDHNAAPKSAAVSSRTVVKRDNQMSLIPAQYSYDGANAPSSIREMTNSSGVIQSEFSYDPYGRSSQIAGSGPVPDFGYAGMYVHQPSGLNLTPQRVYSPKLGRWLSRDPIQDPTFKLMPKSPEPREPHIRSASGASSMASLRTLARDPIMNAQLRRVLPTWRSAVTTHELNPYAYVANNPINFSDPSGLIIGSPGPYPNPNPKPTCPSDGGNKCHPPKGLPEWLRPDCYLWCQQHCDPEDFQACCDECDEHYTD